MSENSLVNLGSLAKPVEILVERFCDGIGGVFRPAQIRRVAKADADAETIRIQGEIARANLIVSAEQAGSDLVKRSIHRMIAQEIKHQVNMEEILGLAIEKLHVSAKPEQMEDEFITRVFDRCKFVSDEDLKKLWANLIAGEANSPRSISRKTIEVVSTLEAADAQLFIKLGCFCYDLGGTTPILTKSVEPLLESSGIRFKELVHLDDLGLIAHNDSGFSKSLTNENSCPEIRVSGVEGRVIVRKNSPGTLAISYGDASLTRVGEELLRIIQSPVIPGVFDAVVFDLLGDDRTVYCPLTHPSSTPR